MAGLRSSCSAAPEALRAADEAVRLTAEFTTRSTAPHVALLRAWVLIRSGARAEEGYADSNAGGRIRICRLGGSPPTRVAVSARRRAGAADLPPSDGESSRRHRSQHCSRRRRSDPAVLEIAEKIFGDCEGVACRCPGLFDQGASSRRPAVSQARSIRGRCSSGGAAGCECEASCSYGPIALSWSVRCHGLAMR